MKRSIFGYFAFIVACIVFSLYVHFPDRTVAKYFERSFSQIHSGLTIAVAAVNPCFPVGMKADTILVKYSGKPIATLENFKFLLNLNTFLGEAFAGTFKADLFAGVLSGAVKSELENVKGFKTETKIKNMALKHLFLGEYLSDCEFSGILNGTINAGLKQGLIRKSSGDVTVTDIVLQFQAPVFALEKYSFSSGKIKFDMPDHKTIKIENLMLKGRRLDLQSSGDIRVSENFQESRLNMKAQIVLYPLFFMDAGDGVPAGVSKRDSENAVIYLRIGGTVHNPIITVDPGIK